jgi:hypothetical protein
MSPRIAQALLFLGTAALVPVLEALWKLDANAVMADPKPWLIGVAATSIRAVAGAALAKLVEQRATPLG